MGDSVIVPMEWIGTLLELENVMKAFCKGVSDVKRLEQQQTCCVALVSINQKDEEVLMEAEKGEIESIPLKAWKSDEPVELWLGAKSGDMDWVCIWDCKKEINCWHWSANKEVLGDGCGDDGMSGGWKLSLPTWATLCIDLPELKWVSIDKPRPLPRPKPGG